jgi:hypothetical protein
MGFKHQSGSSVDLPGDWLKEPGSFHVIVDRVDEEVDDKNGQIIAGAAFRVHYIVLAGTVDGQKEKTYKDIFYHPKPADTEEQQTKAILKMDRFFIAASLMKPEQVGCEVDVDLNAAAGRQMILRLVTNKKNPGYLDCWQEIYHVDDPAVQAVPKDVVALARIPKDRRMIGGQPAPKKPASPPAAKPDPANL